MGFHLSVPRRAEFRVKGSQNSLLHKEQLNGLSFECTQTCSFKLKSLDKN